MVSLLGATNILTKEKERLCATYGIKRLGFFGSYLKKEENEKSDIDLLVEFVKPIDILTFVHLKNELSDILGRDVDLVVKKALKPKIGQRVLKDVLYI